MTRSYLVVPPVSGDRDLVPEVGLIPLSLREKRGELTKAKSRGSKRITMRQAHNIIEAVRFAKLIDLPLVAHLTIHWSLTDVGDDPDGKLFARFREGLDKWLHRHDIAFAAAWSRERQSGGHSDVEHCHLLFHLPEEYRTKKLDQVRAAILRLVNRYGRGVTDDRVIKLVIWPDPDGKYLIKGGGAKVWDRFRLKKNQRRMQGLIFGKRCGATENIGSTARTRWEQDRREGALKWAS